jgi:hypothetical protein
MLSKHRQNRFVGGDNLCVHAPKLARRVLTAGSDETASTSKIVNDVAAT